MGHNNAATGEDGLYAAHVARILANQQLMERVITRITGWGHVGDLARAVLDMLVANQGRSPLDGVRMPCHAEHAPMTVPQYEAHLAQTNAPAEIIGPAVDDYRRRLCERFGI